MQRQRYAGIDPGKQGAMALIDDSGRVLETAPTPLCRRGLRDDYDLPAIRERLLRWVVETEGPLLVTLELLQSLPPARPGKFLGGAHANFARGVARGWEWMLQGLGFDPYGAPARDLGRIGRYMLVRPQTWQKAIYASTGSTGDGKTRSLHAAGVLFPGQLLTRTPRSTKPDDGIAEALLLATYGRLVVTGQAAALSPRPL